MFQLNYRILLNECDHQIHYYLIARIDKEMYGIQKITNLVIQHFFKTSDVTISTILSQLKIYSYCQNVH